MTLRYNGINGWKKVHGKIQPVFYILAAIAILRTEITCILEEYHGRTAGSEVVTIFGQAFDEDLGTSIEIFVVLATISKLGTDIFLLPIWSQRRTASSTIVRESVRAKDGNETRRTYRQ